MATTQSTATGKPYSDTERQRLDALCDRFRVRRLQLFGSLVNGTPTASSDADVLVEYRDEYVPTFYEQIDLAEELSPLFGGRRVDLAEPHLLYRLIKDRVVSQAVTIYER